MKQDPEEERRIEINYMFRKNPRCVRFGSFSIAVTKPSLHTALPA